LVLLRINKIIKYLRISSNKLKANKTGRGSSQEEQLSNIEEDILDIIKTVSVEGHNVEESTTAFDFGEEMDITESEHTPTNLPESVDNTHES
jgi:broad-specificity NMP kinase